MDGDCKGWYLYIDNENTFRPIIESISKKRFKNVAIPAYCFYLGETLKEILKVTYAE